MNKVENFRFTPAVQTRQKYKKGADINRKQNFTGLNSTANKVSELTGFEKNIVSDVLIKKYLGIAGNALNKLSNSVGEVQNIIFIGFGTAFVAPLFIAFNPISKEDPNSKKYSALRQPISAIIATATGLGINMPVARWFDDMSVKGKFKKFDMSAQPPDNYVKRNFKKIKKLLNKKPNDKETKALIKKMLGDENFENIDSFNKKYRTVDDFQQDVNSFAKLTQAKKLLKTDNPEGLKNTTVKDFLIKKLGFKQDDKVKDYLNPDDIYNKLTKTKAMDFLKEMGFDEIDEKSLRGFLAANFYKHTSEQAIKTSNILSENLFKKFEDLRLKNEGKIKKIGIRDIDRMFPEETELQKSMIENLYEIYEKTKYSHHTLKGVELKPAQHANRFEREVHNYFYINKFDPLQRKTISRLIALFLPESTKNEETISLKDLFKVLKLDKVLDENNNNIDFYKNTDILKMKMDKFILEIDKRMDMTRILAQKDKKPVEYLLSNEEKLIKYAENIAKNAAEKGKIALKSYTKFQGILLSLLILPPACTFLNWSYPRVMDALFPKLSHSKAESSKKKGGN